MVERNPGKESHESDRVTPREVITGVTEAARTLAKGVVSFLPHVFETRESENEVIRRRYKLATIQPYTKDLPFEVVQIMLDIDTYPVVDRHGHILKDKSGKPITLYDLKRQSGEVQKVIDTEKQRVNPQ